MEKQRNAKWDFFPKGAHTEVERTNLIAQDSDLSMSRQREAIVALRWTAWQSSNIYRRIM